MEIIDPNTVEEWILGQNDDVEKTGSFPKVGSMWYVVSMKWLNKWREANHVKTDQMEVDLSPSEPQTDEVMENGESSTTLESGANNDLRNADVEIGQVISEDIVESHEDHEPQVQIKPGLTVGREIEILPPKAWNYFKNKYGARDEIIRYSISLGKNDSKVEIYPKQVQVLFYKDKVLVDKLIIFHISLKSKKQDLEKWVLEVAEKRFNLDSGNFNVHLWKFTETHDLEKVSRALLKKSVIPARLLKDNDEIIDLEIADEDIALAELTPISLGSKFREEQNFENIDRLSSNSRRGLTGLQNLGNTCFMNSGIQCLSNTAKLTEYILSDQYRQKINPSNRIGTKGRIVTAYAELIREMWKGSSSSVSPWGLKKALGSFASQFVGFSQQDSQELLSFLIDGIHEDLNQALKPNPKEIADKGLPEREIAKLWWEKHLERNQSIIVDLLHGQYRSEVRCKECNNTSLAFDPFLMLTLPVPSKETMTKEFSLVGLRHNVQCKVELNGLSKLSDAMKKVPEEVRMTHYIIGECDGVGKDIRRMVGKHEIAERNREYTFFEIEEPNENKAMVLCNFSIKMYSDNYGCGSTLGITQLFKIEKGTLKDFHYSIFEQILAKCEEKTLSDEELKEEFRIRFPTYFSDKKDAFYRLSIYNPGRSPCAICRKETCYGCPVPFTDEPLKNCLSVIRDPALFINLIFHGDKSLISSKVLPLRAKFSSFTENSKKAGNISNEIDIHDCLRLFSEEEDLEESESIYCGKCKKHQNSSKKMSLYKLPEHLIIHLKRFKRHGYGMQKNGAVVQFPTDGLEIMGCNGERFVYDLYAVSNHYGSMGGGHYTAFGKNVNGNWYDFNDSSVSGVRDGSSIVSAAAYVLFYKRR